MLFVVIGIVILAAILVPILLPMDGKYTHKKCVSCGSKMKIEEVKSRSCKTLQIEPDDASA